MSSTAYGMEKNDCSEGVTHTCIGCGRYRMMCGSSDPEGCVYPHLDPHFNRDRCESCNRLYSKGLQGEEQTSSLYENLTPWV